MRKVVEAVRTDDGVVPKHEIEVVCAACGYDLDEAELEADTCSDCGAALNLRQSISIHATSVPAAGAKTMGE